MAAITIVGIGNPIMSDDGIGLKLLEQIGQELSSHPDLQAQVELVDGGTSGMELLPTFIDAENLLVLDALAGPGPAGSVHVFEGEQIARLQQGKLSPHQVGLLDLFASLRLLGHEPTRLAVAGIVAADTSLGLGLTTAAAAGLEEAAAAAIAVAARWQAELVSARPAC